LHPIHTESVAWIAGRTDVICTALALASLLCWQIYLERNVSRFGDAPASKKKKAAPTARQNLAWFVAAALLLFAALLAKEMALVALPAAALLAWLFVERPAQLKKLTVELALLVAVAAVYLFLRQVVAGVESESPPTEHTLWRALATFPSAFGVYLGKLFFPWRLSAYLSHPYASQPFSAWGVAGLLALAGAGVALWRLGRRRLAMTFALGAFALSFAPLANVIRISAPVDMGFVMAERFLYLPSAFLCLAAAAGLSRRWALPWAARVVVSCGVIAALAFGVATVAAAGVWREETAVYRNALEANPDAPLLWANLGASYRREGRLDDALAALRKADEINTRTHAVDAISIDNNLGTTLASLGRLDEALAEFDRAARLGKHVDRVQFNRGEALRLLGRFDEALAAYDAALAANGDYLDARLRRAQMRLAKGDIDGAEADLRLVLARAPDEPDALAGLAQIARRRGRLDEAALLLRRSLAQRPDDYQNLMSLGGVLGQMQRFAEAAGPFEQALRLRPDAAQPYTALAAAVFKAGDRARAKELLDEARRRFPNDVEPLIGLLNYDYETRDLAHARQTLAEALALAPQHPQLLRYQQALGKP
jgi:tetratricopeptide (TPR) repeat protein